MTGCKKDDPLTPAQLLSGISSAGKPWVMAAQTLNGNSSVIGDCLADDIITFYPDFSLLFDEGASKCDSNDPQIITGTWILDQNNTHLLITADAEVIDYEILELTESSLILKSQLLDLEVVTTFMPR